MKVTFGKKGDLPAPRHLLLIQERSYKTERDRKIAMTAMRKYWSRKLTFFNLFTHGTDLEGNPRLYFCRTFTRSEINKSKMSLINVECNERIKE